MSHDDEGLIRDVRAGIDGAWTELIDRYGGLALSVPLRMGLSEADAEEVCQATWVILYRHLGWIERPGSIAAWIVTTARREALKLRRARADHEPLDGDLELADAAPLPQDELLRLERLQEVRDRVAEMPAHGRRLLEMLYFAPSSPTYAEVARTLNLPLGSIGPMRGRWLAHLARKLQVPPANRKRSGALVARQGGV